MFRAIAIDRKIVEPDTFTIDFDCLHCDINDFLLRKRIVELKFMTLEFSSCPKRAEQIRFFAIA